MICSSCGRELPEGASFCPYCGARAGGPVVPPPTHGEPGSSDSPAMPEGAPGPAVAPEPASAPPGWPAAAPAVSPCTAPYSAHPPLPPPSDPNAIEWLREGWAAFVHRPWPPVLFMFVYCSALFGSSFFRILVFGSNVERGGAGFALSGLFSMAVNVLLLPMAYSLQFYFIAEQRGENPDWQRFLAGYSRPWQLVASQVFVSVLVVAAVIPALLMFGLGGLFATLFQGGIRSHLESMLGPAVLAFALWMLVVAAVAFFPTLFAPMLIVDQRRGPIRSLQASWELTRGARLQLLLLALVSIPIVIAGVVCLFVGVLVSIGCLASAYAAAYRDLLRRRGIPDREVS